MDRYALLANADEHERLMDATRKGGAMAGISLPGITELARGMRDVDGGVLTPDAVGGETPMFSGGQAVDWLVKNRYMFCFPATATYCRAAPV